MARRVRRVSDPIQRQIPIIDLLYAHGLLCDWIRGRIMEKTFAKRHCEVINNFQNVLRPFLVSNASNFHVVGTQHVGFYTVEPIGGWDSERKAVERNATRRGYGPARRLPSEETDTDGSD